MLSHWDRDDLNARALPYLIDHLNRTPWSNITREMPQSWPRHFQSGQLPAQSLKLCNTIRLSEQLVATDTWSGIEEADWSAIKHMRLTKLDANIMARLNHLQLDNIQSLDASQANLTDEHCAHIALWQMPALKTLHIQGNPTGSMGLSHLCFSTWWPSLSVLHVGHRDLSAHSMQILATAPAPNLHALHIALWPFDWPTAVAMTEAPWTHQLTQLSLRVRDLNLDTISMLFGPALWSGLKALDLSSVGMQSHIARFMARTGLFENLTELNLSNTRLDIEDILQYDLLRHTPELETLQLHHNNFGDRIIESLPNWQDWPALKHLDLSHNRLTIQSLNHLSSHPFWRTLTSLTLDGNFMGEQTLQRLFAQPQTWTNLEHLSLRHAIITKEDLAALLSKPKPPALKTINLLFNHDLTTQTWSGHLKGEGWREEHLILR